MSARVIAQPAWWNLDRDRVAADVEKKSLAHDDNARQRFMESATTFKQRVEQFEARRQAANARMSAASAEMTAKLTAEWQRKQKQHAEWRRRTAEEAQAKQRMLAEQRRQAEFRFADNRSARSSRLGSARAAADARLEAVREAQRLELEARAARNEQKYLEAMAARERVWDETKQWVANTDAIGQRKRDQVAEFIRKHNEVHPRATSRRGGPGGGLWVPTQGKAHSPMHPWTHRAGRLL